MSAGLFTVVDLDDPDTIRTAASGLLQATRDVEESMRGAGQRWSALEHQWVAPESDMLNVALQSPQADAADLSSAGSQAQGALATYASRLEELTEQRRLLLADIADFEAQDTAGDDNREAREEQITELQQRCHSLTTAKDEAQNTCRTALGGIVSGASASRGSSHRVPTAQEADDVEGAPASIWDTVDSALGVTPGDAFENPALDSAAWATSKGLQGISVASTLAVHANTRQAPRQNWAPRVVRNAGGTGNGLRQRAVAAMTGWDGRNVSNGGQFLGKDDSRNPYRRSGGGVGGTLRDIRNRTVAKLGQNNRVANPGQGASVSRWESAGRWAGCAGGAVTGVTTAVSSWREDSAKHPDMGGVEKGARATTVAGGTVAGGAAGAKGGAALGAAVGSMIAPGVGTAAGAVIGGIVGGAAGGMAGGAAGEYAKDAVGSAADGARNAISNTWDTAKSFFGG